MIVSFIALNPLSKLFNMNNRMNFFYQLFTESDYRFESLNVLINPLHLVFNRRSLEADFQAAYCRWLARRTRLSSILIILVILLNGIISLVVSDFPQRIELWLIRLGVCIAILTFFVFSYTKYFKLYNQWVMSVLCLICTIGISIVIILQGINPPVIFFNIIFLSFFIPCVFGMRFISSIITTLLIILAFNIILIGFGEFTGRQLYTYNIVYIIALMMAASINYLLELSIRRDFLHQQVLQIDRKKYAALARSDALTGLANRFGFTNRFNEIINCKDTKSIDKPIGVLIFIDLNRFKPINDEYGHCIGDEVLRIIASRLINATNSANNIVARLGGDEFLIFLGSVYLEDIIENRISDLSQLIAKPMNICIDSIDTRLSVSASIGYSIVHDNEASIDEVICRADGNMYLHKKSRS